MADLKPEDVAALKLFMTSGDPSVLTPRERILWRLLLDRMATGAMAGGVLASSLVTIGMRPDYPFRYDRVTDLVLRDGVAIELFGQA